MALSGSFQKYPSTYLGLYCTWSATQSITGNYSDVTLKVYLKYASLYVGARDDAKVSINGTSETYSTPAISEDSNSNHSKLLKTKTVRVNHGSNGKKEDVALSASWRFDGTYAGTSIGTITASTTVDLDAIDRSAPTVKCSVSSITASSLKISATSSATADIWQYSLDGGTTWKQFSTTAGTSASVTVSSLSPNTTYSVRVRARKKSNQVVGTSSTVSAKTLGGSVLTSVSEVTADASTVKISLKATVYNTSYTHTLTISNGSTSYLSITGLTLASGDNTITLTASQRTTLLSKMSKLKSFTGTFSLATYNGSNQVGSATTKTATVKTTSGSSAPTMGAFTFLDTNSTTVSLTGSDQLFIQGYSTLQVTPGTATAKNGASIVSYSATCNGVTKSGTSVAALSIGTISKSGTLSIVVTATDSRGYTVSKSADITVVAYAKPKVSSVSLRRTNEIEAEMQLTFSGTISPITVSSTQKNALTYVRYRYKKTSASSYGSYTNILSSVTKSGSSFSYSNLELCSLDAGSSYDFHIQIQDKLGSSSSLDLYYVVRQGTPLVALRKQKVGINTPSPEAALHVIGDCIISGTLTPGSLTVPVANISGTLPISKGGTGATSAANARSNLGVLALAGGTMTGQIKKAGAGGQWVKSRDNAALAVTTNTTSSAFFPVISAKTISGNWAIGGYGENLQFVYVTDANYNAGTNTAKTVAINSNGDFTGKAANVTGTVALANGGTGATSAADARSNLGLACTSLYKGTLTSGSATFTYGSHKAYIIMGRPLDGSAICTLIVPKSMITTGGLKYQFADEVNYVAFTLSYSGTTGTVTISTRSGDGFISRVFGVN